MTTTIVYAPHPDDETLRLSGYITLCRSRGDRLILVAATDGGGTSLVNTWNWDLQEMQSHRIAEQTHAWRALAGPDAEIIRLHIPDGLVAAHSASITAVARQLERETKAPEHYLACRDDDVHPDHVVVANAVAASGARVVRYSHEPGTVGGTKYAPTNVANCVKAHGSFRSVGWNSTPSLFNNLKNQGYASYITT